ncbi:hypothetical protein OS493_008267 [Desmophyllum pertusum]|uniref:Uncharacterized protein n=1 Tax=Desmophyllum pertusum TaxID=174260 RepID=A0A9X0A587_9CNID|nr:hypothetical protein OS493_008267 [Desmophyllum pertusum]
MHQTRITENNEKKMAKSVKEIEKCANGDEGAFDATQGPDIEEDACATERSQDQTTSDSKRSVPSYLWLVSSPISQDEENMMNAAEAAVNCTTQPKPSTSSLPGCRSTSNEFKSLRFEPLFSSCPTVRVRSESHPLNGKRHHNPTSVTAPLNDTRSSTSRANVSATMDKTVVTRSVGFGVDTESNSYPGHRFMPNINEEDIAHEHN